MDHNANHAKKLRGEYGGYDLRVLKPEELPTWAPALAKKYQKAARYPEANIPGITHSLKHALVILVLHLEGRAVGFMAFLNIGVRGAAELHITFWSPMEAQDRVETILSACSWVMHEFNLLRIETFIDSDREDVCAIAEACGGIHVGTVPSAWEDENFERRSQEFYLLEK